MQIAFVLIVIGLALVVYFILSFAFNLIGKIALKAFNKFKNNIKDDEEKINNEK